MRTICNSLLCLVILVLAAPTLLAEDLSKYRAFSLGNSLASVLKLTDQRSTDVKIIYDRPVLMQELTWWPVNISSTPHQHQSVEHIVFSFYNGDLYKISVIYDSRAIQGLTSQDMIQTMSAMYGIPPSPAAETKPVNTDRFDPQQRIVAFWADSLSTSTLVRTSSDDFALIVFANSRNAQAQTADAEAIALDTQERPQKEAAQLKQQNADLETARQKNIKSFQP